VKQVGEQTGADLSSISVYGIWPRPFQALRSLTWHCCRGSGWVIVNSVAGAALLARELPCELGVWSVAGW